MNPDEIADKERTDAREHFMDRIYERLGSWVLPTELEDIGLENTPQYDPYEDETQNKQTFPQLEEELETMPEVGDHYVGAEMMQFGKFAASAQMVLPHGRNCLS